MPTANGIISAPVGVEDIAKCLGVGSYDLGYLCSNGHGKINIWSRYKPVYLSVVNVDDTYDKATNTWAEKSSSNNGNSWDRPWFYGNVGVPVYTIFEVSSLSDIGKDGLVNEASRWQYNPPRTAVFYRAYDFLGYNHYALPPFAVAMSTSIRINGSFSTSIVPEDTGKANGEFNMDDLKNFIGTDMELYAGIAIYNRTKGVLVSYVKTLPLAVGADNGDFVLTPSSGSPISAGGFGHSVSTNDVIDVYSYLSASPGEDDFYSQTKYSAYLSADSVTYRRYTVGYDMITVKVPFACTKFSYDVATLATTYYVNDLDYGGDGNVFIVTKRITAVYGTVSISAVGGSNYSSMNVLLQGTATGTRSDGTKFSTYACPSIPQYRETTGSFSTAKSIALNGVGEMSFKGYSSLNNALNRTGGTTVAGLPIYDQIVDNASDAENKGMLSARIIAIQVSAVSSIQYTVIMPYCSDQSNVIYRESI